MKRKMKTELCAGTAAAVRIAQQLRIDRVELCEQLEIGGITPSIGLQQFSMKLLETHVLIRPRGGDFMYSSDEKEVMLKDIFASAEIGVSGIVVGALDEKNELDLDWLREVKNQSKNLELIFHRAYDEVKDWKLTMENLISLGFKRILTSGQMPNVLEGKEVLREMKSFAKGRIEIMAGGGVKVENAVIIRDFVRPDAIHFSGTVLRKADGKSKYAVDMLLPDSRLIEEIVDRIKK